MEALLEVLKLTQRSSCGIIFCPISMLISINRNKPSISLDHFFPCIHHSFVPGFRFREKYAGSLHHRPMKYEHPPYVPPGPLTYQSQSYLTKNLPSITYGFKPVASPYGNLTHPNGLSRRKYSRDIPNHVIDALEEMYARNNYKREAVSQ